MISFTSQACLQICNFLVRPQFHLVRIPTFKTHLPSLNKMFNVVVLNYEKEFALQKVCQMATFLII